MGGVRALLLNILVLVRIFYGRPLEPSNWQKLAWESLGWGARMREDMGGMGLDRFDGAALYE
jgi:hypothetical protein